MLTFAKCLWKGFIFLCLNLWFNPLITRLGHMSSHRLFFLILFIPFFKKIIIISVISVYSYIFKRLLSTLKNFFLIFGTIEHKKSHHSRPVIKILNKESLWIPTSKMFRIYIIWANTIHKIKRMYRIRLCMQKCIFFICKVTSYISRKIL